MITLCQSLVFLGLVWGQQVLSAPVRPSTIQGIHIASQQSAGTHNATAGTHNAAQSHEHNGQEHVIIIDKSKPIPARIEDVLERLALRPQDADVKHIFNNSAFHGFSASIKSHCLDLLGNMSDVAIVEQAVALTSAKSSDYTLRGNSPWGLQTISTIAPPSGSAEEMDFKYAYADPTLGRGADIYLIDTGIYTKHVVFNGRAKQLWSYDGSDGDSDGHGTHTAGTAGGTDVGVAPGANVFGLKALDSNGGGLSSNIVAAIDVVVRRHDERKAAGGDFRGSVMSMSLASSTPVESIRRAIDAAISAGVHVSVAAGNSAEDACGVSPASSGGANGRAITVGAVDMRGRRASFSNYGSCVDLYAPGVDIISAWTPLASGGRHTDLVNSMDGTSMAAPHVTGIIAYAMAADSKLAASPARMKQWLLANALRIGDGLLLANNGVHANLGLASPRRAVHKRDSGAVSAGFRGERVGTPRRLGGSLVARRDERASLGFKGERVGTPRRLGGLVS